MIEVLIFLCQGMSGHTSLIYFSFLISDADKVAESSEDEDEDMDYFDSSPSHKSQTGKELLYKDFFDPPDPEEVKVRTEVKAQAADKGRKLVRFEEDDSDIGSEGDDGDDDESALGEELDWGGSEEVEGGEEGEGGRWAEGEGDTSGEEDESEELENLSKHEKKELMVSPL